MDFASTIVVFGVFFLGLVLAFQGFVGKEINPDGQPFAMRLDLERPGISHPPERHRLRLFLIGSSLMVLAVVLGVILW
jgi:hypothetical protein